MSVRRVGREQHAGFVRGGDEDLVGLLALGRALLGLDLLELLGERGRHRAAAGDEHEDRGVERIVEVAHDAVDVAGGERADVAHHDDPVLRS